MCVESTTYEKEPFVQGNFAILKAKVMAYC